MQREGFVNLRNSLQQCGKTNNSVNMGCTQSTQMAHGLAVWDQVRLPAVLHQNKHLALEAEMVN